jgi:hypothetical protein
MKKQIRQGVFETNSSSTHSICIAKDADLIIPQSLHFKFGEFAWQHNTLRSTEQKASYIYTGLIDTNRQKDVNKIISILNQKGIKVTAEKPIYEVHRYTESDGKVVTYTERVNGGYVDHADEMKPFLDAICKDPEKLMRYLFSPLSFVITGNDEDDESIEKLKIKVSYPHDKYLKGN